MDPKAVLTEKEVWGQGLALTDTDSATDSIHELFTKKTKDMSESDKSALRAAFRASVTMSASQLTRWSRDSRVRDTVNMRDPGSYMRAKNRILSIVKAKNSLSSPFGWGDNEYRLAQHVVWIVQSLNHERVVDYQLWGVLRNFGCDWERPNLPYLRRRTLPLMLRAEIEVARLTTLFKTPRDLSY